MSEPDSTVPESVKAALQSSGFPFQTAVTQLLNPSIGWSPFATEYPWRGLGGESQFLDIVAHNSSLFLCIECKKTKKDILTFLRPLGGFKTTGTVPTFRCLRAVPVTGSKGGVEIYSEDWDLNPISTSSEFCVVCTSESGRDQRLLERDASLVVRATDAFAHDFKEQFKLGDQISDACLFVPIIVTNAPIYTARYKPAEVSLETGEFSTPPKEIQRVAWVRFCKFLTSESGPDLGYRSVFVVEAISFSEFLTIIKPIFAQPDDKKPIHFVSRHPR